MNGLLTGSSLGCLSYARTVQVGPSLEQAFLGAYPEFPARFHCSPGARLFKPRSCRYVLHFEKTVTSIKNIKLLVQKGDEGPPVRLEVLVRGAKGIKNRLFKKPWL